MKTKYIAFLGALSLLACQTSGENEPKGPALAERTQTMYDDFAAGNVDAVVATWDADITWNEAENFIYADGNPYQGADAILEGVFGRIQTDWDNFRLEETTFHNVDSTGVLVTGRYRGTHKESGKELDAQFAHLWEFRDTVAVSFQQYTDTWQAKEATMAAEGKEGEED